MEEFNQNNPTINWSEEEKYDFCKTENKWTKDLKVKNSASTAGKAGNGTLDPTFATMTELTLFAEDEIVDHKKQFKHRCHICDFGTQTAYGLKRHVETHKGTRDRFDCSHCDKYYSSASNLKNHVQHIHEKNVIKFKCKQCDGKYITKAVLKLHVIRLHTEKTVPCNQCDSVFATDRLLKTHQKKVHVQKSFKCDQCHLRFKQLDNVKTHVKHVHADPTIHCFQCNVIVYSNDKLKKHTEAVHDNIKNWNCQICPFSAYDKSNFMRHLRIHTGEKPFACKICFKRFSEGRNLRRHSQTHD